MSKNYDTMADNNAMDKGFEEFVTSSMGIRGLVNKAKITAILRSYKLFKAHFGFDFYTGSYHTYEEICEYFKSVCGVEIVKNPYSNKDKYDYTNAVDINKIFLADTNTFVYTQWDKDNHSGYFYIFGKKSFKHHKYILDHFTPKANDGDRSTIIYTIYASNNDWQGIRKCLPARPFDTLYFDNDIEHKVKSHLDNWMKNKETYRSRGITFKTGILLHGSPGTGKSSLAAAVADYMDCNVIVIDSATFKDLNVNEVTASINADDRMYVVLLDDIDVILTSRTNDKATSEDKANISKLLGFLDSSNSPDNVIFIATTNHIELFDEAITRAGRFDKVIEVGNISKETAMRMCHGFGLEDSIAKDVVSQYSTDHINPADLQVKILDAIKTNMINKEETAE